MKSKLFKPQPHEVIIPSFTITYTGGGGDRILLQNNRFGSHSVPPLFPLPCPAKRKVFAVTLRP
ncbi:MAG: hypothetical protein ACK42G_02955 [Candidatus Kapaibacteriota bacterium]